MSNTREKPKSVLLDACIAIEAYEYGVFEQITSSYRLAFPSVVVRREAKYFGSVSTGQLNPIRLSPLVKSGTIIELAASADQLADLTDQFDPVFNQRIDDGEHEALALIFSGTCPDYMFCTSDAQAIHALAMMGLSERGISFEELLQMIGITKSLDAQYCKSFFDDKLKEGQQKRIQGEGLSPKSRFRLFQS